jgi:hypothetical protein
MLLIPCFVTKFIIYETNQYLMYTTTQIFVYSYMFRRNSSFLKEAIHQCLKLSSV